MSDDTAKKSSSKSARKTRGKAAGKASKKPAKSTAGPIADVPSFPVVGIGASAGGLEAFRNFLAAMPANSGMAFVLIQHLDPTHESLMASLLARHTEMSVVEAEQAVELEPDHVYVIPPNKFIQLEDGRLELVQPVKRRGIRMPIDFFFRSLASQHGERAIGIVLSGTGSDGTVGLREIKAAGGLTIAQEPGTAQYDGMPRSALATGLVDHVLDIDAMPAVLVDYVRHPYLDPYGNAMCEPAPDHMSRIIELLHLHTDYNFKSYKRGTIERRIQRRMGLKNIASPAEYIDLLHTDPDEIRRLFKDLLIGVTQFFREPEAWKTLEEHVIAPLVAATPQNQTIRVWVPACSTGEEAYSVAMLLHDQMRKQERTFDLQVFATDVDHDAIQTARIGVYSPNIVTDVPAERLERYFTTSQGVFRVNSDLRQTVVCALQNVLNDPPFSRLDLICCRNLLIYLESDVQKRLIELFHFALREEGHLFLGASETIGSRIHLFRPVSKDKRIYARAITAEPVLTRFPITPSDEQEQSGQHHKQRVRNEEKPRTPSRVEVARRFLLERYSPATVLVDSNFEAQFYQGPVRDYLDFPDGPSTTDVCAMALENMRPILRSSLQRALKEHTSVTAIARRIRRGDQQISVRITVDPITVAESSDAHLIVSFKDELIATPLADGQSGAGDVSLAAFTRVEKELEETRQDLEGIISQSETANEELRASNEEVMAMNEEMQAANEELESSREELQSLNEELTTLNGLLKEKIIELENTTDDLQNLLSSSSIATVILGHDHRIRRVTPACSDVLGLTDAQVGTPIDEIRLAIADPNFSNDTRDVSNKLVPLEREVRDQTGRYYLRRVLPYRTADDRIDGVVITYTDINRLKQATHRIEQSQRCESALADLGTSALATPSIDALLKSAVDTVSTVLECDLVKVLELTPDGKQFFLRAGLGWKEGLVGNAYVTAGRASMAGYTVLTRKPVILETFKQERRFTAPSLHREHGALSGVSTLVMSGDQPWGVLAAHSRVERKYSVEDVTFLQAVANVISLTLERMRAETSLTHERTELQRLANSLPILVAHTDKDFRYRFVNATFEDWWGRPADKIIGMRVPDLIGTEAFEFARKNAERAVAGEHVSYELKVSDPSGKPRVLLVNQVPKTREDGSADGIYTAATDITDLKQSEKQQQVLLAELDHRVKNILSRFAVVVERSKESADSMEEFASALDGRIRSMARTHSLLSRNRWREIGISALVRGEMEACASGSNVSINGDDLPLQPESAQTLSMVLHELVTNAAKYGALSTPNGRVDISWKLRNSDTGNLELNFCWVEKDGPRVSEPERQGYGTSAIEGLISYELSGRANISYDATGLTCELAIPLKGLIASPQGDDES